MTKTLSVCLCATALVMIGPALPAQTPASPQEPVNNGTVTYELLRIGENTPDPLYHIGGYVCTRGDDHYGPECVEEPNIKSEVVKSSLKLADGRVIDIAKTKVAAVAGAEGMLLRDDKGLLRRDRKGSWNVTYKVVGQRDVVYPFAKIKNHHIEDIEVTFPVKSEGQIRYIVNVITVDGTDQPLHGVDLGG